MYNMIINIPRCKALISIFCEILVGGEERGSQIQMRRAILQPKENLDKIEMLITVRSTQTLLHVDTIADSHGCPIISGTRCCYHPKKFTTQLSL